MLLSNVLLPASRHDASKEKKAHYKKTVLQALTYFYHCLLKEKIPQIFCLFYCISLNLWKKIELESFDKKWKIDRAFN